MLRNRQAQRVYGIILQEHKTAIVLKEVRENGTVMAPFFYAGNN
jgi:hypothetical protein